MRMQAFEIGLNQSLGDCCSGRTRDANCGKQLGNKLAEFRGRDRLNSVLILRAHLSVFLLIVRKSAGALLAASDTETLSSVRLI